MRQKLTITATTTTTAQAAAGVADTGSRTMTQTVATVVDTTGRRTVNAEIERRGLLGWQCRLVRYSETSSRGGQRDVCSLDPRMGLTPRSARRRAERAARRHPGWAPLLLAQSSSKS